MPFKPTYKEADREADSQPRGHKQDSEGKQRKDWKYSQAGEPKQEGRQTYKYTEIDGKNSFMNRTGESTLGNRGIDRMTEELVDMMC